MCFPNRQIHGPPMRMPLRLIRIKQIKHNPKRAAPINNSHIMIDTDLIGFTKQYRPISLPDKIFADQIKNIINE
ncbi:hypothetical protein DM806_17260 [Sphingobium lactosutens]|nr:hypothetical protein [Sphingobium lactosutens]